jgi:hypothetical protein
LCFRVFFRQFVCEIVKPEQIFSLNFYNLFYAFELFFYIQSYCDAKGWQLGLQDPATPIMEHD